MGVDFDILILGGGAMGRAFFDGLVRAGTSLERLGIIDVKPELCLGEFAVSEQRSRPLVLFVAVKPAYVADALAPYAQLLRQGDAVVSFAAGITLAALEQWVPKGASVLRAMPNLAVSTGRGIIGLSGDTHQATHAPVRAILARTGEVHAIPESQFDAFTAVAGSGLAYYLLLIECIERAAVRVGLSDDLARSVAPDLLHGTSTLLAASKVAASELRGLVTSPSGTTAAAIAQLDGLPALLENAVTAAACRSRELGARLEANSR